MTKITQVFKLLFLLIVVTNFQNGFSQTTFTVTSTEIEGPGSFLQAIQDANLNPGEDIIEFTPGLNVNAIFPNFTIANPDMAIFSESVIIEGNGSVINGKQWWIAADGTSNPLGACPASIKSTTILNKMPNFLKVGTSNVDNSGIKVTIKDLTIKQFNSIGKVADYATLNLENFKAQDIWSTLNCTANGDAMISVFVGASLSIKNSTFLQIENWNDEPDGNAAILTDANAGNLTIENSVFYDLNSQETKSAITWIGASSSTVNIVSSRFMNAGGIRILGSTNLTNIVNSTFTFADGTNVRYGERIVNNSSGPMNIISSSIRWNENSCNTECLNYPFTSLIHNSGTGSINLTESALGFNFPVSSGVIIPTIEGTGITADAKTWIEPTARQDANALQTITSQPNLITALPGFVPQVNTTTAYLDTELLKPDVSGVLIDVINTPLINPITFLPITVDALGNDRFDANGFRDIGAIQLALAPLLSLTSTGDGSATINWSEPLHHDGFPILRYEVSYVESSGGSPTIVNVILPNLTATINSLTNGTEYNFTVRAIYDNNGSEENGPYSNLVTATPYGNIGPPVVTAVPGDKEVALSWTLPDLGGHVFYAYNILWRESGGTEYKGVETINEIGTTTKTVSGLKNGTSYEFAVSVNTVDGSTSEQGLASATPMKPAGPVGDNCTLTVGYWSSHSEYGPSPYNATWAQLYAGSDTDFFLSGNSYYEVVNTAAKSNAYYILAKQYVAAELNFLQGADPKDAQDAFDQAKVLLQTYTPADIAGMKGNDPTRKMFVELGKLLESYNSGVIGPGHCPDMTSYDEIAKIDQNDKTDLDVFDATKNGLTKNYPNPFSSNTVISYELFNRGMVTINIYDLKGSLVKTLVNEPQSVGPHEVIWNGTNHSNREMPNGVYFYHVRTNDKIFMNKMMIIKD